jgi:hypothetical protein
MRIGVACAAVVAATILLPGIAHGSVAACEIALTKTTVSATAGCGAAPSWSYRRYDSSGRPCGRAIRGTGTSFALPAGGISTLRVTFARGAAHPAKTFALGGVTSCVTPAEAKPASARTLCAWTMAGRVTTQSCGRLYRYPAAGSTGACIWTSPPRISGTAVSLGGFACPAGDCWVQSFPGARFTFLDVKVGSAYIR